MSYTCLPPHFQTLYMRTFPIHSSTIHPPTHKRSKPPAARLSTPLYLFPFTERPSNGTRVPSATRRRGLASRTSARLSHPREYISRSSLPLRPVTYLAVRPRSPTSLSAYTSDSQPRNSAWILLVSS